MKARTRVVVPVRSGSRTLLWIKLFFLLMVLILAIVVFVAYI